MKEPVSLDESAGDNILQKLGVRRIINAHGSLTVLGGSTLYQEVLSAMVEVSNVYVDMAELHAKAGDRIAELLGAEAAYVTSGAGAGLVLASAACMIGKEAEPSKFREAKVKNEILVQRLHRNIYDYLPEIAGAKVIEYGGETETTAPELERAINERTAAVLYFAYDPQLGVLPLEQVLSLAHSKGIPVIVDAAAEIPPAENLKKFTQMGADIVLFSAGKDLGAPSDTGILLGRRELVKICVALGPQSYVTVGDETRIFLGRPMKTSKEDVVAVVAALDRYLAIDHSERIKRWDQMADYIISEITKRSLRRATARKATDLQAHPRPATVPKVEVELIGGTLSAEQVVAKLKEGDPPIYAYANGGKVVCVNPQCLAEGEERIVADNLASIIVG